MAVHFGVLIDSGYLIKGPETSYTNFLQSSFTNPMSILASYLVKSDNSYAFFYAIVPGNEAGRGTADNKQRMRKI